MNKNYATNLTPREIEAQYERLTLKDDFIFGKVMQEPCNCVEMLQRLTGNVIGSNISINNQKAIKVAVDAFHSMSLSVTVPPSVVSSPLLNVCV